jgi:hypothetical protein
MKNKEFKPIMKRTLYFKDRVNKEDRERVRDRLWYSKGEDYSDKKSFYYKSNDLVKFLRSVGLSPQTKHYLFEDNPWTIHFDYTQFNSEKRGTIRYKFNPFPRKMILKISAEASGDMGIEDLIKIDDLEKYILKGELPNGKEK